jgi:hypothetical protein
LWPDAFHFPQKKRQESGACAEILKLLEAPTKSILSPASLAVDNSHWVEKVIQHVF